MARRVAMKVLATNVESAEYIYCSGCGPGPPPISPSTRKASYQFRGSGLRHRALCSALGSAASVGVHGSSFVFDCSPGCWKPLDKETLTGMARY